jgi:hypothetical protein
MQAMLKIIILMSKKNCTNFVTVHLYMKLYNTSFLIKMLYFHTEYKKNKATYRVDQSIIGHAGFFGQIRICYIPSSSSDSASTMHVIIY